MNNDDEDVLLPTGYTSVGGEMADPYLFPDDFKVFTVPNEEIISPYTSIPLETTNTEVKYWNTTKKCTCGGHTCDLPCFKWCDAYE